MSSSWTVTSKCNTLHTFIAPNTHTSTYTPKPTPTHTHKVLSKSMHSVEQGNGQNQFLISQTMTMSYGLLRGSKVDLSSWPLGSSRTPPSQPWLTISSSPELSLKRFSGPSCLQLSPTVKTCFHTNLSQDLLHELSFEPLPLTAQVMTLGSISTRLSLFI